MKQLHQKKIDDAAYYAPLWDPATNGRPFYDTERHRALSAPIRPGESICDVGAGVYGTCQWIDDNYPGHDFDLWCYDQSEVAQRAVQSSNPNISYVVWEMDQTCRLPIFSESFDVVVSGETIEHMEDPEKFAHELLRIARQNVMISTVNTHCDAAIAHGEYPEHIWEFEPEDLLKFFGRKAQYYQVGDYHMIRVNK